MLSEPPGADPHGGWCGRGQGKPGLYPIRCGGGRKPGSVGSGRANRAPPVDPTVARSSPLSTEGMCQSKAQKCLAMTSKMIVVVYVRH